MLNKVCKHTKLPVKKCFGHSNEGLFRIFSSCSDILWYFITTWYTKFYFVFVLSLSDRIYTGVSGFVYKKTLLSTSFWNETETMKLSSKRQNKLAINMDKPWIYPDIVAFQNCPINVVFSVIKQIQNLDFTFYITIWLRMGLLHWTLRLAEFCLMLIK